MKMIKWMIIRDQNLRAFQQVEDYQGLGQTLKDYRGLSRIKAPLFLTIHV